MSGAPGLKGMPSSVELAQHSRHQTSKSVRVRLAPDTQLFSASRVVACSAPRSGATARG
jgi:hypothetical protein